MHFKQKVFIVFFPRSQDNLSSWCWHVTTHMEGCQPERLTWASVSRVFTVLITVLLTYWHDRLIVHVNELSPQVKWHCVTQSPPLRHTVSLLLRLALTLNKDILSYSNRFFTQKLRTKGNLLFGQNQIIYYTHTPILEADHFMVLCRFFSIYWPTWCHEYACVLLLYTAERIERRDKKFFLSDQCKEIEENNRMGKSGDLIKKIWDTKGTFHAKMGSIKDRNGKDLTQAEDIKKRWQEYTEELYKKRSSWSR